MAKFKEGDWVRRVTLSDEPYRFGEVGKIYKVLASNKAGIVVIDGKPEADSSAFEPWTPKVGERVRVVGRIYKGENLQPGAMGTVSEHYHTTCYGVSIDGSDWSYFVNDLEPLPVAAEAQPAVPAVPLTIQAGKFYKARDGRKVGPADTNPDNFIVDVDHRGRKAVAVIPNIGCVDATGVWLYGDGNTDHDLIAECPSDTTASDTTTNVAATVDAINEEYGPVVAAGDDKEPDTTLHIRFTSDFSELDAAILVRKKKIKKLIKLARKAGIELLEAA